MLRSLGLAVLYLSPRDHPKKVFDPNGIFCFDEIAFVSFSSSAKLHPMMSLKPFDGSVAIIIF